MKLKLNKKILIITFLALIILCVITLPTIYLYNRWVESTERIENESYIWSQLDNTTWFEDDGFAGKTYVFYTDANGIKKCIRQHNGSGIEAIAREYLDLKILNDKEIKIGDEIFKINDGKLLSNKKILTLTAHEPLVKNSGGKIGEVDIVKIERLEIGNDM